MLHNPYLPVDTPTGKMFTHDYRSVSSKTNYHCAPATYNFTDKDGNVSIEYQRGMCIKKLHQFVLSRLDKKIQMISDNDHSWLPESWSNDDRETYSHFVSSGEEKAMFVKCTASHLSMYKQPDPTHQSLTQCAKFVVTYNDMINKEVIESYLQLASQLVPITYTISDQYELADYCAVCGTRYKSAYQKSSSSWRCPCGNKNTIRILTDMTKHSESEYNPAITFMKDVGYIQGKFDEPLPPDMFEKIDAYFTSRGILRKNIMSRPLDDDGIREGTTLDMMMTAFEACGFSPLFKRAAYMCKLYWGWRLPDLEPYIESMMKIYNAFIAAYKKVPKERKSNLPTQMLVLETATRAGAPITHRMFKLPKTVPSKTECEMLRLKTCLLSDMPYIRIF